MKENKKTEIIVIIRRIIEIVTIAWLIALAIINKDVEILLYSLILSLLYYFIEIDCLNNRIIRTQQKIIKEQENIIIEANNCFTEINEIFKEKEKKEDDK